MVHRQKLENGALALSVFGAILIVPPILSVFNVPVRIYGAPLAIAYLFVVWIGLIMVTALLSRHMKDLSETSDVDADSEPEGKT